VAQNEERRQAFENAFAAAIGEEGGTAAEPSWHLLPGADTQLSEEQVHAAIEGGGFDGVLITRLLSVDKSKEYTPPQEVQQPAHEVLPGQTCVWIWRLLRFLRDHIREGNRAGLLRNQHDPEAGN
jgi:hypothetical protein